MNGNAQRILKALEPFNLPIYYAEIPEDELSNMQYFYYRETRLDRNGTAHFIQFYEVAYISVDQNHLMEEEIINALESTGFKFQSADYERIKLESTNQFVDMVIFTITKPLKRSGCI